MTHSYSMSVFFSDTFIGATALLFRVLKKLMNAFYDPKHQPLRFAERGTKMLMLSGRPVGDIMRLV